MTSQTLPESPAFSLETPSRPIERCVQVCVLTYKRPAMLAMALHSLVAQQQLQTLSVELHILVVDNDAEQSGRATFDEFVQAYDVPARYVSEPANGLSFARNRALEESAEMDLLAFLDDDEVADAEWLFHMITAMDRYGADVVAGPVRPLLGKESPRWIEHGRFFASAPRHSGTPLAHVATDNVMMRPSVFRNFRFDKSFNASGGEDTHFFLRVHGAGLRMVWADDACIGTWVPPERANARWIIGRAYSDASRYTHARLSLDSGPGTRASRLLRAGAGAATGSLMLLAAPFGRRYSVRALRQLARSVGTMAALCGRRERYYGASHE